jgi:hypothetical protein
VGTKIPHGRLQLAYSLAPAGSSEPSERNPD